jgi:hemolysin activation/secretion protein
VLWALSGVAVATDGPGLDIQRRQSIQLEQSQARLWSDVDNMHTSPAPGDPEQVVVPEDPCFTINAIKWQDVTEFSWLEAATAPFVGRCMGAQSLKRLRDYLTFSLLERGYITSRVVYPQQNLSTGLLVVQIIPGRVGNIVDAGEPIGHRWFALATTAGALLNRRDLDQTLENLRRLPSQADMRIDLLPGSALGESDLQLRHGTGARYQGSLTLDDAGSRSTGKNQLSANLGLDSPLGMYDYLTLSYNTNADHANQSLGSRASGLQWSLPLGYASFSLGVNSSNYKQTVAGFAAPIVYTGETRAMEAGLGLTTYRTGAFKGQTQLKLFRKISRNYIDDTEIAVQARDAVGGEVAHTHKHFIGPWAISLGWVHRFSLPSWSKNPGILVGEPDWNGRYRLNTYSLSASRQGDWAGHLWHYQTQLRWQQGGAHLPPFEYTAIGGRYSVRGFNGENTLSAASGGYWRNEAGLILSAAHQLYFALDAGRIAGPQAQGLTQPFLAGAAIGLRGRLWRVSYDLSLGRPLSQPDTFPKTPPVVAASFAFEFNG